jgi:hypothetical protein
MINLLCKRQLLSNALSVFFLLCSISVLAHGSEKLRIQLSDEIYIDWSEMNADEQLRFYDPIVEDLVSNNIINWTKPHGDLNKILIYGIGAAYQKTKDKLLVELFNRLDHEINLFSFIVFNEFLSAISSGNKIEKGIDVHLKEVAEQFANSSDNDFYIKNISIFPCILYSNLNNNSLFAEVDHFINEYFLDISRSIILIDFNIKETAAKLTKLNKNGSKKIAHYGAWATTEDFFDHDLQHIIIQSRYEKNFNKIIFTEFKQIISPLYDFIQTRSKELEDINTPSKDKKQNELYIIKNALFILIHELFAIIIENNLCSQEHWIMHDKNQDSPIKEILLTLISLINSKRVNIKKYIRKDSIYRERIRDLESFLRNPHGQLLLNIHGKVFLRDSNDQNLDNINTNTNKKFFSDLSDKKKQKYVYFAFGEFFDSVNFIINNTDSINTKKRKYCDTKKDTNNLTDLLCYEVLDDN